MAKESHLELLLSILTDSAPSGEKVGLSSVADRVQQLKNVEPGKYQQA